MYAPGPLQQQQQAGYTPDVQTQQQAVVYASIIDEKQVNGCPQQPISLPYTAPAYGDPQLTSTLNYPPQTSYIHSQASSTYPPEKVHFELYNQPQPGPAFPPQGTPYTQPLPPGVYPPEKTDYSLINQPSLPSSSYPPSISEKSIYDPVPQSLIPPPPPYASPAQYVGPETVFYSQPGVQQGYHARAYVPSPAPLIYTPPPSKPKDEKKSGTAKRFLGDTLVGRFASMCV